MGVHRLVVGTQAIKRPDWFRDMCHKFPHRLVAGIDARDGRVATDGWLETSHIEATALARELADQPIAAIVYTDIAKDGMMAGPNLRAMEDMAAAVTTPVIASGGVTTAADVTQLVATGRGRMYYRAVTVRGIADVERCSGRCQGMMFPVKARETTRRFLVDSGRVDAIAVWRRTNR